MNDDALRDLRELRARAYGPGADLAGDADAHARLADLEEQVRAAERARVNVAPGESGTSTDVPHTPESPASVSIIEGLFAAPDADASSAGDRAEEPPVAPRRSGLGGFFARIRPTRPVAMAWAASLVVVAVLTAALVAGVESLRPISAPSGARQVATIGDGERIDDDAANAWFGAEGARSYEFLGLTVLTIDESGDDPPQTCIAVVPTDSVSFRDRTFSGQVYSGCAVGAFPATAEFTVLGVAPAELRALYPIGTAVQFVLVGDEVVVFADAGSGISASEG